jgi:hypothetical protein
LLVAGVATLADLAKAAGVVLGAREHQPLTLGAVDPTLVLTPFACSTDGHSEAGKTAHLPLCSQGDGAEVAA